MSGNLVLHLHQGQSFEVDGPAKVTVVRFDEWVTPEGRGSWQAVVAVEADKSVNIVRTNAKVRTA